MGAIKRPSEVPPLVESSVSTPVTFLMAWSIVISTSPFSGLILTIVSRYNLDIKKAGVS